MISLLYAASASLLILISGGYILSRKILNPRTWDYEESYRNEVEKNRLDDQWFRSLPREDIYIESHEGFKLHGIWFPLEGSAKSIIISHGYTYTLFGSAKYMKLFRDRGFNILLTDHRYHGLSEGKSCTMGHREKMDFLKWTNWIESRVGKGSIIGSHGESMGASTALLHGELDERIKFIIADCPYQDLKSILQYRIKAEFKLPAFPILHLGNLFSKVRGGMFFGEVSPLESVKKMKKPVLFIHGMNDGYTPSFHTINLHKAKGGSGFLYLVPEADHGGSYSADPENYRKVVYRFLDNCGV